MSKHKTCQLVIDASIARAAGPEDATHPTSAACRDFLLTMLKVCHQLVYNRELKDEWDKHQSSFALKWRATMFARKKVIFVTQISHQESAAELAAYGKTEKEQAAILKDTHLIFAALVTDKRIASLDQTIRGYLNNVATLFGTIKQICWVNPTLAEDEAIDWLQANAPLEPHRMLGYQESLS